MNMPVKMFIEFIETNLSVLRFTYTTLSDTGKCFLLK